MNAVIFLAKAQSRQEKNINMLLAYNFAIFAPWRELFFHGWKLSNAWAASALRGNWNGCCWGVPGLVPGIRIEAVDAWRGALCTDIGDQAFFPVGVIDDFAHNEIPFPQEAVLHQRAFASRLTVIAFQ